MNKYKVRYHFSNDFYVMREVEAEGNKEGVLEAYSSGDRISFEDKRGDLISFLMKDVKLITIEDERTKYTNIAGF
ncbi:hypothetical protein GKZ89_07065 [Bacillus mangrovi]|uniref:Uncharacterized protein n=1 Tax=Metabacillus mangrovi TaxID=1491830 RepID=A0A7X2S4L7_9BACI|nr:hypothetical protein [Metabacillus mangrovi]MTH53170.1 hypothetical protein [Metabacillus mangrovi]